MKILLLLFQITQHFLLMQPIEQILESRDFSIFNQICGDKVSVYFENPIFLRGHFQTPEYIEKFSKLFSEFQMVRKEWSSQQVGENYAIQSLNLILKSKKSDKSFFYKFIFFMSRDEVEIFEFDGKNNRIVFVRDPGWVIGGEFDVTGGLVSNNQGRYRIVGKVGAVVRVERIGTEEKMETDIRRGYKAKAWKLYYLRGINI